ncbi:hypothetical protein COCOBI_05-0180 [Coccomyxa sp. Obi]|nr:hypothetical protein COCOBI_05-0180 [Coccomyxa sp. Obi]
MSVTQLLQDWDRDQRLIDQSLDRCFQALQRRKASLSIKDRDKFQVWDSARSEEDSPHADARWRQNGFHHIVAPEICAPLTSAALEWLQKNEPLLKEIAGAVEGRQMLTAQRGLSTLCERYGLELADLGKHSDILGMDIQGICDHAQRIHQMLEEAYNNDGWTVSHESEVKVYYRHLKGDPHHSVKLEAVLEAPIEHALALAVEYDLTKRWNSFMKESAILHAELPFLTYIYGNLWTPLIPFDACVKAEGYDLGEEDRSLLVGLTNMTEEEEAKFGPLPAGHERRRRALIGRNSCFRLEALPPKADGTPRTRGIVMGHLNPRLPFVPGFLVNFVLKVASPVIFKLMKKAVAELFQDPEGEFCRRMRAKPEVYAATRMRTLALMKKFYGIDEYAPALQQPSEQQASTKVD